MESFGQKKHILIQCMMSVSDLYITSKSNTASFFAEEVQLFFKEYNIPCVDNAYFLGKSGFMNKFDFTIPPNKTHSEILIKSINNPTNENIKLSLFQWEDTKEMRKNNTQLFIYFNDAKHFSSNVINSCESYGIKAFAWKNRKLSLPLIA